MIKSVMASLLLVAAGIAVVWAGTPSAASPTVQGVATGAEGYLAPQPQEHGDGVKTKCWLQMTPVLHDPAKGRDVRYVSYGVNFESSYAPSSQASLLIGSITGLVEVDPDSVAPVESSLGGLDPGIGLAAEELSPPAHSYKVIVHPPDGQPWRMTDAHDVVVDVIRLE